MEDITGYHVYYNETMINVNSSTTTLTFTAPSLPDGVFTDTVIVMVIASNKFGAGPASNPATAEIYGTYVRMYVRMYVHLYIYVTGFAKRGLIHAYNFSTLKACN